MSVTEVPGGDRAIVSRLSGNFRQLVLGCIDSYDGEQRRIFLHFFEIYKICILLHRSNLKFCRFFANFFAKISGFSRIFASCC